jgi:hypothetical protein
LASFVSKLLANPTTSCPSPVAGLPLPPLLAGAAEYRPRMIRGRSSFSRRRCPDDLSSVSAGRLSTRLSEAATNGLNVVCKPRCSSLGARGACAIVLDLDWRHVACARDQGNKLKAQRSAAWLRTTTGVTGTPIKRSFHCDSVRVRPLVGAGGGEREGGGGQASRRAWTVWPVQVVVHA